MPTDKELQDLLDRQACIDVVGPRYSHAIDWLDVDMLKTCFHADGWVDYGFFEGNAHDWCDAVMPIEKASEHRFHYCFNTIVEVTGDKAEAETNSLAGGRAPDPDTGKMMQSFYGSRYLDKLEKRDGVWRISERRTLLEFAQPMEAGEAPGGGLGGLFLIKDLGPNHKLYRPMSRGRR